MKTTTNSHDLSSLTFTFGNSKIDFVQIKDFPNYVITETGNVFSLKSNKFLKPTLSCADGYPQVILYKDSKKYCRKIHSLVANHFLVKPNESENVKNLSINHKDGNKKNNFARNLEFVTQKENIQHAVEMGLIKTGEDSPLAKYTDENIINALLLFYVYGKSKPYIEKVTGLSQQYILRVINNKLRKNIWNHEKLNGIQRDSENILDNSQYTNNDAYFLSDETPEIIVRVENEYYLMNENLKISRI